MGLGPKLTCDLPRENAIDELVPCFALTEA